MAVIHQWSVAVKRNNVILRLYGMVPALDKEPRYLTKWLDSCYRGHTFNQLLLRHNACWSLCVRRGGASQFIHYVAMRRGIVPLFASRVSMPGKLFVPMPPVRINVTRSFVPSEITLGD